MHIHMQFMHALYMCVRIYVCMCVWCAYVCMNVMHAFMHAWKHVLHVCNYVMCMRAMQCDVGWCGVMVCVAVQPCTGVA